SITDGQIFLDTDLFYSGIRPAINAGISVSRVGGNAQVKAMKQVAGTLRLELAQYRELEAFAQFGSDLDKATQRQLQRGERLVEILKQGQYAPLTVAKQIVLIYAATTGRLDGIPVTEIGRYEGELHSMMDASHQDLLKALTSAEGLSDEVRSKLDRVLEEFTKTFEQSVSEEVQG
ncbi:MAG TPA: F0F1 ATP synthase subunit alpha, partial [Candidatus Hydrogenedentes bacterium]|nr:F0F1 ATP synthase subunit alpha [Candidatus Hydrogenedentota bacterium]